MGRVESEERTDVESHVGEIQASPRQRKWWHVGDKDVSFVSVDADIPITAVGSSTGPDSPTGKPEGSKGVFAAPEALEIYKPVDGFEGTHRFDPTATWTAEEEKKIVRALDWYIAVPACLMFFTLQLDRGNITQALSDGMLKDLDMITNDYNNGQSIFYCTFLFAELPSQLISKKLGPDNWIPIQMVMWSAVAASQAALKGRTSFFVCRALLGLCEGGFIPDMVLYLSYFFKNSELPRRLSWFWTAYQSTQIVGALMAYGILHLRGHGPLGGGWRYLFLIEGCITGLFGILTWMFLPASPTQTARTAVTGGARRTPKGLLYRTKGLLRPKHGWFSAREETIMVTRILRDDPGKATMHNRQGLSPQLLWEALTDYDLWPIYLIGLTWTIPMTPPAAYITLTCKALGFNTFETNLLTIPSYVLFIMHLLFWTWVSEKINQRVLVGLVSQFWVLPSLVALVVLPPVFSDSNWAKWVLSTLICGYPYVHAILVALTSRNAGSVRTRTVGSSLYNMAVQMSNIISTQIYRTNDAPYYYRGNKALLGLVAWNIVLFVGAKIYYVRRNRQRDAVWGAMTREERVQYLATTEDKGNKRLDFRFAS